MEIKRSIMVGFLGVLMLGVACKAPEDIEVERDLVNLAFPIFESETTLSDLIDAGQDSSALIVYNDNSMGLEYETTMSVPVPLPKMEDISVPLLSTDQPVPAFPISGVQLKRAKLSAGSITFHFENNQYQEKVNVEVMVSHLSNGNGSFRKVFTIEYDGDLPATQEISYPLAGYTIDVLSGQMAVRYSAKLADGSTAAIEAAQMVIKNVDFEFIAGKWASKTIPLTVPKLQVGFFDHYTNGGKVTFTNPKLRLIAQNSVGLPAKFNFNDITVTTITNQKKPVEGTFMTSGFGLAYPQMSQMGKYLTSSKVMDKTNSNIVELFGEELKAVDYDMDFVVCPNGPENGFVAKSSRVDLGLKAELPFEGKVSDYKVVKDFDVKFTNEYVKAAVIKLQAKNQIPMDARIQMYFLDNAGIVLDSLVASNGVMAIASAVVDPSGNVIHAEEWQEEMPISQEKWERIRSTANVRLVTSFTSSAGGSVPVRVKANQHVELNAGIQLIVLP